MNPLPFPWHLVDRANHEGVRALADVRRFLAQCGSPERAVARLAEIADATISFRVPRAVIAAIEPRAGFLAVVFSVGDAHDSIVLLVEDALAANFTARAMKRNAPRVFDPSSVAPGALAGAVAAFVSAAARASSADPIAITWCGPASDLAQAKLPERMIDVSAVVLVSDDAFEAHLCVPEPLARRSRKPPFSSQILASLGDLPITLPIVAAAVVLARGEIDALAPADVALLGERFRNGRDRLADHVAVAAHDCERGMRARLGEDGSLVILEGAEEIAMTAEQETAAKNAGESPVVVRVEIGQVTMKAREWAALAPGDVIATGRKIADPIVLRVAGVEVARGELVELEGEVGVRIVSRS